MTPRNGGAQREGGSSGSSGGRGGGAGDGPDVVVLKKGPWTGAEDQILMEYVKKHGEGNWNSVQKYSGLNRCGKSCRLRWANHLRPNLKKGAFTPEEERLILELHAKYGNKWARMAAQLPGRTDNEIKNYWNTRVKRRKRQGLPLYPSDIHLSQPTTPTSSLTPIIPTPTTPSASSFSFQSQTQLPFPSTPPPHSPMSSSPLQSYPTLASPSSFEPNSFSFSSPSSFTFHRPVPVLEAPLRFKSCLPFSPAPQSSSPLLGQSTPAPLTDTACFQFPLTFDATLPQNVGTQFEPDHMGSSGSVRSVKSELPSSQFPQTQPDLSSATATQRNGGLLEDLLENLLEEAQRSIESSSGGFY